MSRDREVVVDGITYYREPQQTMTLGELIKALERYDDKLDCRFDFGRHRPSCLGSWRGDYSELSLISADNEGQITVGEVRKMLKGANGKRYTGWKGGEFKMNLKTRLWTDQDGDCTHTGIVGVTSNASSAIIQTAFIDS